MRLLMIVAFVALMLFWIVQTPVGAAETISSLTAWTLDFLEYMAGRIVDFLNALF